jgi:hypothetical protein
MWHLVCFLGFCFGVFWENKEETSGVGVNNSDRLVHVTKDGKMKSSCSYESTPWCATMFGSDIIVITTTQSINFHKC